MNGGIGSDGFTSVWNSPISSPARTLTAPISVIPRLTRRAARGLQVDDENVTSRSGVPRSSKLGWTPRIGISGSGAGARTGLVMSTTLRATTDNSAGDTRRSRLGSLYALERIEELRNAGAGSAELLGELRGLLVDGHAWAAAEGVGTERARMALAGLESALDRAVGSPPLQGVETMSEAPEEVVAQAATV